MSDPLAEALKVEDRKHRLTFEEGINPRCKCGYKFAYEDATHVIDLTTHAMETLADAARAFIGDEIQQEADEVLRVARLFADGTPITPSDHGEVMGLRAGASIARNGRHS